MRAAAASAAHALLLPPGGKHNPPTTTTTTTTTQQPNPVRAKGFKSYRGSATVGPLAPGLVCVVGPNGAGKSVIVRKLLLCCCLNAARPLP